MAENYRSRKEQIEKDFIRRLLSDLKKEGCSLTRKARARLREEMRAAALVGACEERGRSLKIIRERGVLAEQEIVKQGVLQVLGYE